MKDRLKDHLEGWQFCEKCGIKLYQKINGCSGMIHLKCHRCNTLLRMDNVSKLYEELISFSDLYDSASFEAKKMIVNQLIRRVDVYRGYQLNITFNFDLTPYIEGDDAATC